MTTAFIVLPQGKCRYGEPIQDALSIIKSLASDYDPELNWTKLKAGLLKRSIRLIILYKDWSRKEWTQNITISGMKEMALL